MALLERLADVGEDVTASEVAYKIACATRERQERDANQRPAIEQRIAIRQAAEAEADKRADARERLLGVAASLGLEGSDVSDIAGELRRWQARRQQEFAQQDVSTAEWAELEDRWEAVARP